MMKSKSFAVIDESNEFLDKKMKAQTNEDMKARSFTLVQNIKRKFGRQQTFLDDWVTLRSHTDLEVIDELAQLASLIKQDDNISTIKHQQEKTESNLALFM